MKTLRFAICGAGFWARFQLGAWTEIEGVECVAIYNRTLSEAKKLAKEFRVNSVYDNAEEMLVAEKPDFLDVVISPFYLSEFVKLAAAHKIPVISQKPMAPSLAEAGHLIKQCKKAGISYFIHENWRWQEPTRELKKMLQSGVIGKPFRSRIYMTSGYPVFKNEPTLANLDNFILTDLGTHILDVARFLFGEAHSLYCHTQRIHPNIKGEDVATVMMKMGENKTTVVCEMGYPENHLEHDIFPQTYYFVEGTEGSIEVTGDYWIKVTTAVGTHARRLPPKHYKWADADYAIVHASIVECNQHFAAAFRGEVTAETTADDNIKTLQLVYVSYDSAREDKVIDFSTKYIY